MDAGNTTFYPLQTQVMANLQYMTVYVNGANQVVYTGDPYAYDLPLAAKMGLIIDRSQPQLSRFATQWLGDPDLDLGP